jgi:hypothetical protein
MYVVVSLEKKKNSFYQLMKSRGATGRQLSGLPHRHHSGNSSMGGAKSTELEGAENGGNPTPDHHLFTVSGKN